MNKLEQIRQESKNIKEKIDDTEERLRQLKKSRKTIAKVQRDKYRQSSDCLYFFAHLK
ncbi:TPA: hypothetical protein ACJ5QJ_001079 [Streptococcus agalactiae]